MKYLASQKRKSLGLGNDAAVLQVMTIDELQLVFGQSEVLQNNSRKLVDVLIGNLASWMISGNWHARQHEAFQLLCRLHFRFMFVLRWHSAPSGALVLAIFSVVCAGHRAQHDFRHVKWLQEVLTNVFA